MVKLKTSTNCNTTWPRAVTSHHHVIKVDVCFWHKAHIPMRTADVCQLWEASGY